MYGTQDTSRLKAIQLLDLIIFAVKHPDVVYYESNFSSHEFWEEAKSMTLHITIGSGGGVLLYLARVVVKATQIARACEECNHCFITCDTKHVKIITKEEQKAYDDCVNKCNASADCKKCWEGSIW